MYVKKKFKNIVAEKVIDHNKHMVRLYTVYISACMWEIMYTYNMKIHACVLHWIISDFKGCVEAECEYVSVHGKMTHPCLFLKFMSHFFPAHARGKTHAFNKSPTNHILPLVGTKLRTEIPLHRYNKNVFRFLS